MFGKALLGCNGSVGGGTPEPVDLTQGLVAHCLLNNNADDATKNHTATLVGTSPDFQGDSALTNIVSDNYYTTDIPTPVNNSSYTLSMWIRSERPTDDPQYRYPIWSTVDNLGFSFAHSLPEYTCSFWVRQSNGNYIPIQGNTLSTNTWYHLVLVVDGTNMKQYINGVFNGETTFDGTYWGSGFFTIGSPVEGSPLLGWGGNLANYRFYNDAKNQAFIDALYAEGYYPKPLPLPTTDGLVAHYPLTGTAEDAHGEGGNESGTEYNGVAFVDENIFKGDKVAVLDGVDDYVGCGDVRGSTSEITVSIFANADTTNSYDFAIRKEVSTDQVSYSIGYTSLGKWYVGITTDNNINFELVSNKSVVLGEWANISFTYKNGEGIKLYIDGVLDNSSTTPTGLLHYDTLAMNIGKRGGAFASNYFDGKLSNARVYNVALLQGDISDIYVGGYDSTVVPTTTGLVAHYKLNGSATDETGTYNGAEYGSMVYSGEQRGDSVASFDGVNDYILYDNALPFIAEASFSTWIKLNTLTDDQRFIVHTDNINPQLIILRYVTGAFQLACKESTGDKLISCTTVPLVDKYYHVVGVFKEGVGYTIYINGINEGFIASTGTWINASGETFSRLTLGVNRSLGGQFFNGQQSDIRIYDRALTQTEVTALYNEINEPTDGLVAYYPLTKEARSQDMWVAYDGTEVGGLTYVDDAEFGSVANFDGSDKYITTTTPNLSSVFSVSIWLNSALATKAEPSNYIFNSRKNGGTRLTVNITSSGLSTTINGTGYSHTISANIWYNYVAVSDGVNLYIYINGILQSTTAFSGTDSIDRAVTIGGEPASSYSFNGKIRSVNIYNIPLTQQEITDIYNYEKNFRPIDIDDGLVAYYPLADNSLDNYLNQYDGVDTDITYNGLSAVFNGSTSKIAISNNILTYTDTEFHHAFWIKIPSIPASDQTFYNNHYLDDIYYKVRSSGKISMGIRLADLTYISIYTDSVIPTNEWIHVVCSNGAIGGMKIYVNGVAQIDQRVGQGNRDNSYASGHTIGCGADSGGVQYLLGEMAITRIAKKEITEEQVAVIYNTEKGEFGL